MCSLTCFLLPDVLLGDFLLCEDFPGECRKAACLLNIGHEVLIPRLSGGGMFKVVCTCHLFPLQKGTDLK